MMAAVAMGHGRPGTTCKIIRFNRSQRLPLVFISCRHATGQADDRKVVPLEWNPRIISDEPIIMKPGQGEGEPVAASGPR